MLKDQQKELIREWVYISEFYRSKKNENCSNYNNYMSFISLWIAFNSLCYNRYYIKANTRLPNIVTNKIEDHIKKESKLNTTEATLEKVD